jgi:hypothetical protein
MPRERARQGGDRLLAQQFDKRAATLSAAIRAGDRFGLSRGTVACAALHPAAPSVRGVASVARVSPLGWPLA